MKRWPNVCLSLVFQAVAVPAGAQVVLDGTVGSAGSGPVAAGLDDRGQSATYLIHDGLGERAGQNLFHSFSRFDIGAGETATFTSSNPVALENVLARVTGGSESRIFGQLRSTIPGADLWLINPAGWLFGEGSALDVPGSLHVTSGDYVRHAEGSRFGVDIDAPAALSIAPVETFGFLDSQLGTLTVENTRLHLETGETLSLVGGGVVIRGAAPGGDALRVSSGRINIAAVASPGEVVLDESRVDPQLVVDSFAQLGRIEITDGARVVYAGDPGGTAVIRADSFLLDRASLDGTNLGDADHPGVSADLDVRGEIAIRGAKGEFARVDSTTIGAGRGGSIRVRGDSLRLEHEGPESYQGTLLSTSQGGDPGDIDIAVRSLRISGRAAGISSTRWTPSTARGGSIRIEADEVWLRDARIDSDAIPVADPALFTRLGFGYWRLPPLDGYSGLPVMADAGAIEIRARTLSLTGNSAITAHTAGSGRGGDIHIVGEVRLEGSAKAGDLRRTAISSRTMGPGDGGHILIEGRSLILDGPSAIATSSWSPEWVGVPFSDPAAGDAGSVTIRVDDLQLLYGGTIGTTSYSGGAAGDILIHAPQVLMEGRFSSTPTNSVFYTTPAITSISARAEDSVAFSPTGARTFDRGAGDAGDIDIVADELRMDSGWIASSTSSEGAAGSVTIRANRLWDSSRNSPEWPFSIESESFRQRARSFDEKLPYEQGPAGNVHLIGTGSNSQLWVEDTLVSARTGTPADGGELFVDFDRVFIDGAVLQVGSTAYPQTFSPDSEAGRNVTGRAGDLTLIAADTLRLTNGSRISAESISGDGGDIGIVATNGVELFASSITAEVGGGSETTGGNISIDPKWVILEDGSVISANASQGSGGNVSIRTQGLFVSPDSRISASSQYGLSGTVAVDAPESNLSGELASLTQDYLDAPSLISDRCGAGNASAGSIAVKEELAIAPAPDEALSSPLLELVADGLAQIR